MKWPTGIGGKGNEGVAAYVKQINGGIGYVELSYALQNKMAFTRMKNAAGNFVQPRDETFAAAAASADWANAKDFYLVMTNAPGEQSWPITATNFILMYKQPKNAAGAKDAKEFFKWVYANGDAQAKALDYVPLPDALVQQIEPTGRRTWRTDPEPPLFLQLSLLFAGLRARFFCARAAGDVFRAVIFRLPCHRQM